MHKTTVLRLLRTLAEQHFVFRDGNHRYHLGARVFELSAPRAGTARGRAIAARTCARSTGRTGARRTCPSCPGSEIVYIDKLDSHDHVRMASRIGLRAPLHSTAAGKVLLADLPRAELERVLGRASSSPGSTAEHDHRRGGLRRRAGRGPRAAAGPSDREENETSINCIAAPVRSASGRAVAAVSVSVPDIVLTYDGAARAAARAARP